MIIYYIESDTALYKSRILILYEKNKKKSCINMIKNYTILSSLECYFFMQYDGN